MTELELNPFSVLQPTRNQSDKCQLCSESFSVTTRQHLCKRCFRFVCSTCSPHKIKTYRADLQQKMHRLCHILKKYVQKNKLSWAQDSDMSKLWLKQLGCLSAQQPKARTSSYNKFQPKRKKIQFSTTIQKLWSSFNFTFRQLVGMSVDRNKQLQELISQQNKKQKSKFQSPLYNKILQQILNSLSIVISIINNDKIQYQNVLFILIFFLVHASLDNAIILTKQTVNLLTTQQVSLKDILYYLQILQCSPTQIFKIQEYLDLNISRVKNTASINYLSVQLSIQIICSFIMKKDTAQIEKALAYIFNKCKKYIVNNASKSNLVQMYLLKNHQGFDDGYKRFIKLCQNYTRQQPKKNPKNPISSKQQKIVSQPQYSPTKTQKKVIEYEDLVKQNQQLRKRNKIQQRQLQLLKEKCLKSQESEKRLIKQLDNIKRKVKSSQKRGEKSLQSEDDEKKQQFEQFGQEKQKQNQFNLLHNKNRQIKLLKQEVKLLKKQLSQIKKDDYKTQQQQQKKQSQQLKQQLSRIKQMNKKLLKKMSQLSEMLMDKQDQQLQSQNKQIQVKKRLYFQEIQQQNNQECCLF